MANILNCCVIFSQIWKQQKVEAEASGIISLKFQSIDGLFEATKFEKVKGSNIVNCVKRKYFSYIIDKIVLVRRNFSKAFVILAQFLLLLLLLFLLVVYISLAFHLEFFKVSFFDFLSYKYTKIWYFHGQYEQNVTCAKQLHTCRRKTKCSYTKKVEKY